MKRLLIVLVALLLAACGSPKEPEVKTESAPAATPTPALPLPSAGQATTLIAESAEFSEFEFTNSSLTLPMSKSQMNEPALESARDLIADGWIRYSGHEVLLTPKAKEDKRFLVRANGFLDVVPLAKKELTEVSAPVRDPEGNASVEFCWKWIPNEVGSSLRTGLLAERFRSEHCGTATLQPDGSGGWEVLLLTRRD